MGTSYENVFQEHKPKSKNICKILDDQVFNRNYGSENIMSTDHKGKDTLKIIRSCRREVPT